MEGTGAHSNPSTAAAGWRLPGEMFADRDTAFLHISVIRAAPQTQLARERRGCHGPQSRLQPPGLSPGSFGCPVRLAQLVPRLCPSLLEDAPGM